MGQNESYGFEFKQGLFTKSGEINPLELINPKLAKSTKRREVLDALAFAAEWYSGKSTFELKTSGSTGPSKIIEVTRAQMIASAQGTINTLQLTIDDHSLLCLSTQYIGGKMMMVRAMELGNKCTIIPSQKDPLAKYPTKHKFTFTALVPTQLQEILNRENGIEQLKLFKAILIGGGSISLNINELCVNNQLPIWQTFGMTETVSHIALRNLGNVESNYKCMEGIEIGVDDRGCLWVEGAVTNHERIQSNDNIDLISATEFKWIGRYDNVINSGGIKFYPEEIESEISSLIPSNISYFIHGVVDQKWGQKAMLFLEAKEAPIDLLDQIKSALGSIKCPKEIVLVDEFERTTNGKIQRKQTVEKVFSN